MLVIALWVLAMISGLSWARWSTGLFSALTGIAFFLVRGEMLGNWFGWVQLMVLVSTPWLLAAQRHDYEQRLSAQRRQEAERMTQLQEVARRLLSLHSLARELESQIAHITDVYHVTKETSAALHLQELFVSSLDIVPRLLKAHGLRLIDFSGQKPLIWRATLSSGGRLIPQDTNHILDMERVIIDETMRQGSPSSASEAQLSCSLPKGITRVAWAPLWRDQKPIGVLVADNLPEGQVKTLSTVANQLSLQLSRIHLYQRVESMAVTDALTGVFVRRHFLERTAEELTRAKRHNLYCTLLMVDLDHFKQKNDTYGHLVGDVVLKEVAQLLKRNLREIDLIARYGGEEFVLLLVETSVEHAMPIAERLRQLVEIQPIRAYDEMLTQTISVGAAGFPEDAQGIQSLIERSDHALYAAKHAGRNCVARATKD